MNAFIRFEPHQCWEIDGRRIRFERELGDELLHFIVEDTLAPFQVIEADGNRKAPDRAWALEAFADGRLRMVASKAHLRGARREAEAGEFGPTEVLELDPKARVRWFVLTGFDQIGQFSTSARAIHLGLQQLWREQPERAAQLGDPPPIRTVRRWMVERGAPGERAWRQMVSMQGRVPRKRRLAPVLLKALDRAAVWYWTSPRFSIADAYAWMAERLIRLNLRRDIRGFPPKLKLPHEETLRKVIRACECFETYAAKWGQKKAEARFKPAGRGLTASRFLELGCMDSTLLDAIAVDANAMLPLGRVWLTVLIDVRTRCVVGFVISFEPPSLYHATECLKRANRPKLHLLSRVSAWPVLAQIFGRFDEIVLDNGLEFSGVSFQEAAADVGTSIRWAPVASPTYKAIVERFFRTLNDILNHKLPGGVLKPALLREMGYDPSKDAVLTVEEIEDLIWEAISYYHIELHSGIGRPPADLWRQDMEAFRIPVIGDDRQLDRMVGTTVPSRTLTKSGVSLFGLQYHDPGVTGGLLEDLAGTASVRGRRKGSATVTVKVKFNPANLAEIHVWNAVRKTYVTLPCVDERYSDGISLWHHQQIQRWAKETGLDFSTEEERLLARAQLNRRILESAPELRGKQRKAAARLLHPPKVLKAPEGHGVTLAHAPSRHDGLAPVIPHEPLAPARLDAETPATRPPRAKRKAAKSGPSAASKIDPAKSSVGRARATVHDAYVSQAAPAPPNAEAAAPQNISQEPASEQPELAPAQRWKGFSL